MSRGDPVPLPPEKELAQWVRQQMSPARWRHTLGVVESATTLAERWGADVAKARVAALLHDCARDLPSISLLKMTGDFGIVRDKICDAEPVLYHGPVAAAQAQRLWAIQDATVLAAIAFHTTGRPNMSLLEKIIFVADAVEPGRTHPGVEEQRQWAQRELDRAFGLILRSSLRYLIEGGRLIHPDTVAAYNELVIQARS